MQFRQKIGYMTLGGLLVLAGHVLPGLVVQRADAQGERKTSTAFDTLTVRSLRVLDVAGRVRAKLEVTGRGSTTPVEDVMQVFNGAGVSVCRVGMAPQGGIVSVLGSDGGPRADMSASFEGGSVSVSGNDDVMPCILMAVGAKGGYVSVSDSDAIWAPHVKISAGHKAKLQQRADSLEEEVETRSVRITELTNTMIQQQARSDQLVHEAITERNEVKERIMMLEEEEMPRLKAAVEGSEADAAGLRQSLHYARAHPVRWLWRRKITRR